MGFPETRLTLVERLAAEGNESDWRTFLHDYWGPVYRFALRRGAGHSADAEEVASQTFLVLWQNRLLTRWVSHRSAKLRTLLCSVARNILSNRRRLQGTRQRLWQEVADHAEELSRSRNPDTDAFYAAWVEDLLAAALETLARECHRNGQGDQVRVLYGRICEDLSFAEIAKTLDITVSSADYYFRRARARLGTVLEETVRSHVARYCGEAQAEVEFAHEWQRLGEYLAEFGGLEDALRRACASVSLAEMSQSRRTSLLRAATRLTSVMRSAEEA